MDAVDVLAAFLLAHPRTLVLTGAGMSTDSGIPGYRGPDGARRVSPMEHGEFVGSAGARRRYWARSYAGWERFAAAGPNAAHRAVAALQRAGHLGVVITQNVDGLHEAAGSRDVIALHGRLSEVVCLSCGRRLERAALQDRMTADNPGFGEYVLRAVPGGSQVSSQIRPDGDVVLDDAAADGFVLPLCPDCGSDLLKPDVVFFGGSVARDLVQRCADLVDASPALLVLGSSLAVMSGLRWVRRAAARGIPVAVVTQGWTRAVDEITLRVDAPLTPTLVGLADRLVPGPVR